MTRAALVQVDEVLAYSAALDRGTKSLVTTGQTTTTATCPQVTHRCGRPCPVKHLPAHAALDLQRAQADATDCCVKQLSASSLQSFHLYAGLTCLDEAAGHWCALTVRLMYERKYSRNQVRRPLVLMIVKKFKGSRASHCIEQQA